LINERSGVLNLGAEGMMLVAAIAGFAVGYATRARSWALLQVPSAAC
jgi:simple sugar transport system permease protein